MATEQKTDKNVKTTVFNLIILDESGSMSGLTQQTISGCNETLNVIRSAQKEAGDDARRSLVSIFAFQNGTEIRSRYLCKNVPIEQVKDITTADYRPWGNTPLYDAVGSTLTDLEMVAATHEDATAIVTVITDGYENSSRHYTGQQVAQMILRLKELGWIFNIIGANIDVEREASRLSFDNSMAFQATPQGTREMFCKFSRSYADEMNNMKEERDMDVEDRIIARKMRKASFFKRAMSRQAEDEQK